MIGIRTRFNGVQHPRSVDEQNVGDIVMCGHGRGHGVCTEVVLVLRPPDGEGAAWERFWASDVFGEECLGWRGFYLAVAFR